MFLLVLFTLPAFAEKTILVVGDTLSAGYGLQPGEGWVLLLQKKLEQAGYDYKIVNSSISGDTTSNGLTRLPGLLKQYQPAITLIELGGNDGLRGLQLSVIKRNLQQMIALSQRAGSTVLLIGVRLPPNYGEDYVSQFMSIFKDLAKSSAIALVPNILQDIDNKKDLMSPDGIHPKGAAQATMMETVWTALKPHLK